MKIQMVTPEHRPKVYALLTKAFAGSDYETRLVRALHEQGRPLQDWVCIQTGRVIAYIAFSRAFQGEQVCGLHLAPMAVAPEWQLQGVGGELLRFALRQESIRSQALFVLGEPGYYRRFGFVPCTSPTCPFDRNNEHFLSLNWQPGEDFVVGYEPEFSTAAVPPRRGKPAPSASRNRKRKV